MIGNMNMIKINVEAPYRKTLYVNPKNIMSIQKERRSWYIATGSSPYGSPIVEEIPESSIEILLQSGKFIKVNSVAHDNIEHISELYLNVESISSVSFQPAKQSEHLTLIEEDNYIFTNTGMRYTIREPYDELLKFLESKD